MGHWGPVWGKDETTRFQNDAVRDDLRLGAEGKQVVEPLGGAGRGSPRSESADFNFGGGARQELLGLMEEGLGAWDATSPPPVCSKMTTVNSLNFFKPFISEQF